MHPLFYFSCFPLINSTVNKYFAFFILQAIKAKFRGKKSCLMPRTSAGWPAASLFNPLLYQQSKICFLINLCIVAYSWPTSSTVFIQLVILLSLNEHRNKCKLLMFCKFYKFYYRTFIKKYLQHAFRALRARVSNRLCDKTLKLFFWISSYFFLINFCLHYGRYLWTFLWRLWAAAWLLQPDINISIIIFVIFNDVLHVMWI